MMTAFSGLAAPLHPSSISAGATRGASGEAHVPALDGIRGVAILLVLIHHLAALPGITLLNTPVGNLGELGAAGVDLFFVLSGFLITGILLDNKGHPHYFRNFYARRTLRIFPLYYAVVFVTLLVLPRIPHAAFDPIRQPEHAWSYWLYLSNLSMGLGGGFRHGILDVTWSLAIEEQFYLLWPLVVWMLSPSMLLRACGGLLALGLLLRATLLVSGAPWEMTYLLTPCRLDGLIAGSIIALCARHGMGESLLRWGRGAGIASAGLVGIVLLGGTEYYQTPVGQLLASLSLAGLFATVLIVVLFGAGGGADRLRAMLSQSWLRLFGKFSYALYLTHVPILAAAHEVIYAEATDDTAWGKPLAQLCFAALCCAVALGIGWLSWHLYEKQFLALKRYFPTRPPMKLPAAEHVWRPALPPSGG